MKALEQLKIEQLIEKALEAREYSYSPYSNFAVGAAVLSRSGAIYSGCNIESSSYAPSLCAERTAIAKAVSEGEQAIEAVAVVGSSDYTFPCGVCRQVIREFGKDATIIVANSPSDYKVFSLEELLPHSFGPEDLEQRRERDNDL